VVKDSVLYLKLKLEKGADKEFKINFEFARGVSIQPQDFSGLEKLPEVDTAPPPAQSQPARSKDADHKLEGGSPQPTTGLASAANVVPKGFKLVQEATFELLVPEEWGKAGKAPQGFDVGFQRPGKEEITLFLHFEHMPEAGGDPPTDTSDMQEQWVKMVRSQYSDANQVVAPRVKTVGSILIDQVYDLTDSGTKLRRRYTYQYVPTGRLAFITQCSAPPGQWDEAAELFQVMIGSLRPAGAAGMQAKISPEAALKDIQASVPKLATSFPDRWACQVPNVVWEKDKDGKPVLLMTVAFQRNDVAKTYKATKAAFEAMAAGKVSGDMRQVFPEDAKDVAPRDVSEFIKYVGQLWGLSCSTLVNCREPPETIRMAVSGPHGKVGTLSLSYENALKILRTDASNADATALAKMYRFE
jgi:hypothetical protein